VSIRPFAPQTGLLPDMGRTFEQEMAVAIVESSDDAIISKDLDGTITSWNAAAQRLFGYTAEEALGQSITMLMPEQRHDDMKQILGRIRRGQRVEHYETIRVAKDGRLIPVSLSVSPIRNSDNQVVGAAKIARDITDRRKAEAERERLLGEAQRAIQVRDMFLSVAGHEFRTPLNALTLQLYNLERKLSDPSQRASVAKAQAEVERLALLTHQLLDVARTASGGFSIDSATMDLSELVAQVVARLRDGASAVGSVIELRLPGPIVGTWDRSRLDQVVTNLLDNALKFGQGSAVDVSVEDGSPVRIRIRDRGIGVAAADRERIFARFERGVSEQSFGGLGLGLWIAQGIVVAHGGRIGLEAIDGPGATFFVELPR
jgi:PAS domain S-box-containing protein